jgi:hypothetical protein
VNKKDLAQWVSLIFKKQFMSHNIRKRFETTSMYITNLQYHGISIDFVQKSYNNMFVQNLRASKCKNGMKIYMYYFYINGISFLLMTS